VPRIALLTLLAAVVILGCDKKSSSKGGGPGSSGGRTQPPPPGPRPPAVADAKPVAAITHAIVISVDGLRPDLIYRAPAPNLIQLTKTGTFSLWARSAETPLTLPSHTSMFTGVTPTRHGIHFNEDEPGIYPAYPTLFEVARKQGLTTAIVAGKTKLRVLAKPGTITWEWLADVDCEDVAGEAERVVHQHRPNLLFVHFRDCDYGGHFHTWGSPEQLAAVRRIDAGIGRILAAVDSAGLAGSTLILVTADHGGSGSGHGSDPPGSTIPWIVRGPGVHPNFDLERIGFLTVHVEDTFATVSLMLGLPIHPDIDGKPITQIVDQTGEELLRDSP
jgi:hypothetical protein